jgi:hypothetical protein
MAKQALNLTAIQQAAINKVVSADAYKTANGEITPGEYPIDLMVRITGALKKGEKYQAAIHWSVDWCGLFAVALSKLNGVTVESIVREFCAKEEVDTAAIKVQAEDAINTVKGTAMQECNGKLSGKVFAEIVDTAKVEVL